MAKRKTIDPVVRQVRGRYNRAISLGHSPNEAARLAHSNEPILRAAAPGVPTRSPPKAPPQAESPPPVAEQSVEIVGRAAEPEPIMATTEDIPPNWEDLPWPELRSLASRLAGHTISSRRDAVEVLEERTR